MKSGTVLEGNSLSAPMIDCDDHDREVITAPQSRHHPQNKSKKIYKYQIDNQVHGMMHNHPSGDPTPSRADIDMTKQVIEAARALSLTVHDHLIVGREGVASFKQLGLM